MTAVRTTIGTPHPDAYRRLAEPLGLVSAGEVLVAGPRSGELVIEESAAPAVRFELVDAQAVPTAGGDAALSVLPLRITPDVPAAAVEVRTLGLTPRIASDGGGWADFIAPGGGLLALHAGEEESVVLSFEYAGPLETLQSRLADAGIRAALIDENYGRTLRIADPDGGEELWVNEAQTDLHGYHAD